MADGYFQAFIKIWNHCWIEWEVRGPRKTFLRDFINEVSDYGFITVNDILICLVLGLFITILRYFLTIAVFKVGVHISFAIFLNKSSLLACDNMFFLSFCKIIDRLQAMFGSVGIKVNYVTASNLLSEGRGKMRTVKNSKVPNIVSN